MKLPRGVLEHVGSFLGVEKGWRLRNVREFKAALGNKLETKVTNEKADEDEPNNGDADDDEESGGNGMPPLEDDEIAEVD